MTVYMTCLNCGERHIENEEKHMREKHKEGGLIRFRVEV